MSWEYIWLNTLQQWTVSASISCSGLSGFAHQQRRQAAGYCSQQPEYKKCDAVYKAIA